MLFVSILLVVTNVLLGPILFIRRKRFDLAFMQTFLNASVLGISLYGSYVMEHFGIFLLLLIFCSSVMTIYSVVLML